MPLLLVAATLLSAVGVGLFFWAVRGGQFDDLEDRATRALRDLPPGEDGS